MIDIWLLQEAENHLKKYQAIRISPVAKYTSIEFGRAGSSDYTISRDKKMKDAYLARHYPRENWENLDTAGAWSRWLSWNKPSISESIADIERRFGVKIINGIYHG
jgi:hypothetical protein